LTQNSRSRFTRLFLFLHFLFSPKISSFDSLRISAFLCYNLPVKTIAAALTFIIQHSSFFHSPAQEGYSFRIRFKFEYPPYLRLAAPFQPHHRHICCLIVFDLFVLFLFEFE